MQLLFRFRANFSTNLENSLLLWLLFVAYAAPNAFASPNRDSDTREYQNKFSQSILQVGTLFHVLSPADAPGGMVAADFYSVQDKKIVNFERLNLLLQVHKVVQTERAIHQRLKRRQDYWGGRDRYSVYFRVVGGEDRLWGQIFSTRCLRDQGTGLIRCGVSIGMAGPY